MIPCLQLKCLKYPVCQSKEVIQCTQLRNFYNSITPVAYTHKNWDTIHKYLPKVMKIISEELDEEIEVVGSDWLTKLARQME